VTEDQVAELARLRKLEQSLRAERERIRAAAAGEVLQLQTALRETAARAAQREREVEGLRTQLQRGSGGLRLRRRRLRPGSDTTGAVQRVVATFERERQQLEERARAVAETELRQRKTQAELDAERDRLRMAGEGGNSELLAELRQAERRIDELEAELTAVESEHASAREELEHEQIHTREVEVARREEAVSQLEIELSLVRRRIGEEERRLQERAWRTGGLQRRQPAVEAIAPRPAGEPTFSEGWTLLSRGRDGQAPSERPDWGGGNW
jgi:hypothetical protein